MEREHLERSDSDSHLALMPSEGKTLLAREYAKYKNRLYRLHDGGAIFISKSEPRGQIPRLEIERW